MVRFSFCFEAELSVLFSRSVWLANPDVVSPNVFVAASFLSDCLRTFGSSFGFCFHVRRIWSPQVFRRADSTANVFMPARGPFDFRNPVLLVAGNGVICRSKLSLICWTRPFRDRSRFQRRPSVEQARWQACTSFQSLFVFWAWSVFLVCSRAWLCFDRLLLQIGTP